MIERLRRLRAAMASLGAEAAIITHPANRRYFSGYPADDHAPDESAGVLVVAPAAVTLYASPTNLPWAEAAAQEPVSAQAWERPWPTFVGNELRRLGLRLVAFEDAAMSVANYSDIVAANEEITLVPAGAAFHALRAVKDTDEVAAISDAARLTDAALAAATADANPGISERALAWRIERAMRELGADGPAFPTCVAAGPHGARPHHDPTDRGIGAGEPVVIDLGARVRGYCGDLTRTIVLGEPSPEFTERYNSVLRAQQAALAGTRAGMTGRDADRIARDSLSASGYGEQFIHGLGHGVGLLIHESPSLGEKSDDVLQPGHVVTIEPGIYLKDWGGIRIEDVCVITPTGLNVLSHAPK